MFAHIAVASAEALHQSLFNVKEDRHGKRQHQYTFS